MAQSGERDEGPDRARLIAGVLLAAGAGTRFGGAKLLARLADGTPVAVSAARALRACVDRCVAVVRPSDAALAALLAAEGLTVLPFERAADGMGASLAFGVASVAEADGWVVALADMPFVRPETVEAVVARLRAGAWIAAPFHAGRRGHPVGFARGLLADLTALTGDVGAREILARDAARIEAVETADVGIHMDVDALGDLSGAGVEV